MNYTDPRCIRLRNVYGIEGYGLLHCLLDMLSANGGSMPADFEAIAMHLSVSADMVRGVACSFNLFPPVGDDGLLRHPDSKAARPTSTPLSRTERARRAALARWHKEEYAAEQGQQPRPPAAEPLPPPCSEKTEKPVDTCRQTELDLGLPPNPPPPPPPAPLKQQAVALWCDTYRAHFGLPYQMTPRDAGTVSNILQRIRRTAAQLGNSSPSDSELIDTLRTFYQTALSDPFISDNATLTLINSQYNKIIKSIYAAANPTATAARSATATAAPRSRAARDNPAYLQDLYRRVAEAGAGFVSNSG